jgi:SNF2 family DNA or RNA helicase
MSYIRIYFKDNTYFASNGFEDKEILKESGFRFISASKRWETANPVVVSKAINKLSILPKYQGIDILDESTKIGLSSIKQDRFEYLNKSMSYDSNIEIPIPVGLSLLGYQKSGVDYISKFQNVLIADEPGLGKTIECLSAINYIKNINSVLVICPAIMNYQWMKEAKKWLIRDFSVNILNDNDALPNFAITNYESMKKYFDKLTSRTWDLLILDESHYIKSRDAQRTRNITGYYRTETTTQEDGSTTETKVWVKGLVNFVKRRWLVTGTPIMNHPFELLQQLKVINHPLVSTRDAFNSFKEEYCVLNDRRNKYGVYSIKGYKNLSKLQKELRATGMLRRSKENVLPDLPKKMLEVYVLDPNILSKEEQEEQENMIKSIKTNWDVVSGTVKGSLAEFDQIMKARHKASVKKIPMVIDLIEKYLDEEQKIVIFAHFRDVIDQLYNHFKDIAVVVTGDTSIPKREEAKELFEKNDNIQLYIGSIMAMGVGISIKGSSMAVFADIEWRPSDLEQAEDRLHGIERGGNKDSIMYRYVVIDNSIDAYMVQTITEKRRLISQTIDSNKINNE